MRLSVILVVLLIGWSAAQSSLLDLYCSGVHRNLNEADRNISISNGNRDTFCDSTLRSGWYTFGKNAHIPDRCTRTSVCSAEATFWTSDELPSLLNPGPRNITICRSESDTGSDDDCRTDCSRIQAAYCANIETIIYELKPVSVCDVRYCFQERAPCPPDEGSPSGSSPNCRAGFPFSILRNGTTRAVTHLTEAILSSRQPGVYAFCSIDCQHESCGDLIGDVYWHTNEYGEHFQRTDLQYDANRRILYSFLTEDEWISKSNYYIHCKIVPRQSSNRPFNPLYTTSYFFGLTLEIKSQNQNTKKLNYFNQKSVALELSDLNETTASLTVKSNIPIVCGTNTDGCFVIIQMEKEGVYNDTDIIRTIGCSEQEDCKLCQKKLSYQTIADENNKVTWNIIATVNVGNRFNTDILSIVLKTISGRKVIGNFWKNLLLPTVQIILKRANLPARRAASWTDPRMQIFDGFYFDIYKPDEYLVMENLDTLLRVHAYIDNCVYSPGSICTRKLFIETVNELVVFDALYSDQLEYKMLSSNTKSSIVLRFVNGVAELPTDSGLKITNNNGQFEIWTHFATMIQIIKSHWGNYNIYPSKADFNKVTGLFGNYTDIYIGSYIQNYDPNSFSVTNQKSNRPRMNNSEYYYNSQKNPNFVQYCICTNQTGEREFLCPLGRIQQDVRPTFRRKRQANQDTDDIALSNQLRKFVQSTKTQSNTFETRGKRQLGSSCSEKLNSASLKMCNELGIINLKSIIYSCEQDFINMGIDFSDEYVTSSAEACVTLLKIDDRFKVERKARSLQSLSIETLLSQLCYKNCSGTNGRCNSKAQCSCNSPYAGDDCSINTSIPPKLYSTVFNNDVCDKNAFNCKNLILSVDRILPNTIVNFNAFYKDENGNMKNLDSGVSGIEVYSSSLLLTHFEVDTHNSIGSSVVYYNINVQDSTKSNSIMYAIYNSACHICDSPTTCYVKERKCDIQGVCYNAGDKNPISKDLACNPQLSKFKWT